MREEILYFFDQHMEALPLYEALEKRILEEIDGVQIQVQKTQISFYNRHLFACVSFARVKKKKECPPSYIVVTLGLPRRLESPRVTLAVEPYPGRWTHHFLIAEPEEIDEELFLWVQEAADFADKK